MKKHGTLFLLFFSASSLAAQFPCSTNMQYVSTGDSIESVIAACGQPTQVVKQPGSSVSASGGGNLIWFYQTNETNQTGVSKNGFTASAGALASTAPTINVGPRQVNITTSRPPAINLGVIFANGQVIAIQQQGAPTTLGMRTNNANGLSGQTISNYTCANGPIQVGSTMNDVTSACGLPVLQKTMAQSQAGNSAASAGGTSPTTLLVYKAQSYLPTQTFVFQNGLLAGQK